MNTSPVVASFTVGKPAPLMNMNQRLNRWDHNKLKVAWRDAAFWWAKQQRLSCRKATGQVVVWIEFGVKDPNRRRDPHNYFPTIKAICDGFTAAAVWEDDDVKHVRTLEPAFTNEIDPTSLRINLAWEEEEG